MAPLPFAAFKNSLHKYLIESHKTMATDSSQSQHLDLSTERDTTDRNFTQFNICPETINLNTGPNWKSMEMYCYILSSGKRNQLGMDFEIIPFWLERGTSLTVLEENEGWKVRWEQSPLVIHSYCGTVCSTESQKTPCHLPSIQRLLYVRWCHHNGRVC